MNQSRPACQFVSAIPGRVRLRLAGPLPGPEAAAFSRLNTLAAQIETLPDIEQVELVPAARSLIVYFDRRRQHLKNLLAQIRTFAAFDLSADTREPAGKLPVRPSAAPGALLSRRPTRTASANGRKAPLQKLTARAARTLQQAWQHTPGQTETITAISMPPEKPRGLKGLLMPTLAVALAAVESLPIAIVGAALAIAAIPIFQRAAKGVSKQQLTVDQLDLANVVLLALEGSLLTATAVTWLVGLGELIRGETVVRGRKEVFLMSDAYAGVDEAAARARRRQEEETRHRLVTELMQEPLSNTRSQDNAMRTANSLAYPLAALGTVMALVRRDAAVFIDIVKPRNDFAAVIRFSDPTSLLNAIAWAQRRGVQFKSGAAVEALARANAFLLSSIPGQMPMETALSLVERLARRGARYIALPAGAPVEEARARIEAAGYPGVQITHGALQRSDLKRLRAQGLRIAMAGRGTDTASGMQPHLELRLDLPGGPEPARNEARVLLQNGGDDILLAIDIAQQAMRIVAQNTTIATGATTFNFLNGLVQALPSPVPTLVNTLMIAATAANAQRLRTAPRAQRPTLSLRRLPESARHRRGNI